MIALHVVAILVYWFVKHDNLVRPMIVGKKLLPAPVQPVPIVAPLFHVVLGVLVAMAVVWAVLR